MLRLVAPQKSKEVDEYLAALRRHRPAVKGQVCDYIKLPPQLRRPVLVLLEVGLRLLEYNAPIESGEDLEELFKKKPAFRTALSSSIWFESDGKTIREELRPKKAAKKK